jgi:hypothetical protein
VGKLTKAQRRVLSALVQKGGKATPYDLAYPRSPMMHRLVMAGLADTEGPVNLWGEPSCDGFWTITPAGRAALSTKEDGDAVG